MLSGRNQSGDMGDIEHQHGARLVRYGPEAFRIDLARVGRGADHDELRLLLLRKPLHFREVDGFRLAVHAVRDDVVQSAGEVHGRTVGQMAAVGQVHRQDRIAGFENGEVHRHIGLRTRMRLDVYVVAVKEFLRTVPGQVFRFVDDVAAAVVPVCGIALRVFVREDRSRGGQNGRRDEILGSDEFDSLLLSLSLASDHLKNFRIRTPQNFRCLTKHPTTLLSLSS